MDSDVRHEILERLLDGKKPKDDLIREVSDALQRDSCEVRLQIEGAIQNKDLFEKEGYVALERRDF